MAQLYHWPVPCTTCESPVEYHCNTCGDVLCPRCKDIHLKSNATKHHDVVTFAQRVKPNQSSKQCGDHPGHQCGVWCQTCNKVVCGDCVISPNHKGHRFLRFDEKIAERKMEIQSEFDKYSKILSDWRTSLQETEMMKEKYEEDVNKLDREIVDRGDEICKQVRGVEKESRRRLQKMKKAYLRSLQVHQKMLRDGMQTLKKKIKELEDTLRSNETSAVLQCQVEKEKITDTRLSPPQAPVLPVFAAGSVDVNILNDMFGSLSERRVQGAKSEPEQSTPMNLLAKAPVESVIKMEKGWYYPAIACVGSGQTWVRTAGRRLQLLDRDGVVMRTVNTNFNLSDMAVTPNGDILLSDYNNKRFRSMSVEGDVKTISSTKCQPYGICCLPSGDIVVTFNVDKKVVQCSRTGKIIREMDEPLVQYPWYVAYSQVNQHLYVIDKSDPDYPSATGRVLALDMKYRLKYTYTGSGPINFTPMAVCSDLLGHVLITDYDKNTVHILDKGGNFLQYLLTDGEGLTRPVTIDVDSDGYALIGGYITGKVQVVKYTAKK